MTILAFVLFGLFQLHLCNGLLRFPRAKSLHNLPKVLTRLHACKDKFNAVMVVPTGIGATIGGYAGDALPAARLLASVVDNLITHPNVLNGAILYMPIDNIQYVEGSSLDAFAEGKLDLHPLSKGSHRIGLLLDKAMEEDLRIRHIQVADAMRATLGVHVAHCVVTSREVGVQLRQSPSGAAWGSVGDTDTLVEGARVLVEEHGCTAVAVVVRFPEDEEIEESESLIHICASFTQVYTVSPAITPTYCLGLRLRYSSGRDVGSRSLRAVPCWQRRGRHRGRRGADIARHRPGPARALRTRTGFLTHERW
jgi:hypothetical protein